MRWGILGTGGIGRTVIPALVDSPVTAMVAVAGRSADRAAAYAAELGVPDSHGSFEELLARDDLDAVYVATPPSHHAQWVIAALRAGKHVLSEKPFALDPDAVRECYRVAAETDRQVFEAFMWRYHPQTVLARRLIAQGVIGEVRTVRAALTITSGPGDIRLDPSLDGGAVSDLGCYCLSAIRLFGGRVEQVTAQAVPAGPGGVDDLRLVGTTRSACDVLGLFDCGLDQIRRDEPEIIGTAGKLVLPDPWLGRPARVDLTRWDGEQSGDTEAVPADPTDEYGLTGHLGEGYRIEFDTVSRVIAGEVAQEFGGQDAVDQARTVAAVLQAARSGDVTAVPRGSEIGEQY